MQHSILRLLGLFSLVVCSSVWAQTDSHQYEGEAVAHCEQALTACEAQVTALEGLLTCADRGAGQGSCASWGGGSPIGNWHLRHTSGFWISNAQCTGINEGHAFCEPDPELECETEPGHQVEHYNTGTIGTPLSYDDPICNGICTYVRIAGTASDQCNYSDTNGNGSPDDGEPYSCPSTYVSTGDTCNTGSNDTHPEHDGTGVGGGGNNFDCDNVDCENDPDPGGGTGNSGSGDPVDPQDPPGGETAPPADGDGDPGTPSGPGLGDGDVDGDGDRDIDCNPQSNPECGFTGSGTGSGNCDVQPSCSGDPVQCAILYQEWASMCYDGGDVNNPASCQQALSCEGDVMLCEIIRQERQQYCDLYVGDGSVDTHVLNDSDFNRDLKEEAETVDIPTALEGEGFASASCPAAMDLGLSMGTVSVDMQMMCDVAGYVRPLVILSALLIGAFIVVGVKT